MPDRSQGRNYGERLLEHGKVMVWPVKAWLSADSLEEHSEEANLT
jgi:hypothetical protein